MILALSKEAEHMVQWSLLTCPLIVQGTSNGPAGLPVAALSREYNKEHQRVLDVKAANSPHCSDMTYRYKTKKQPNID